MSFFQSCAGESLRSGKCYSQRLVPVQFPCAPNMRRFSLTSSIDALVSATPLQWAIAFFADLPPQRNFVIILRITNSAIKNSTQNAGFVESLMFLKDMFWEM